MLRLIRIYWGDYLTHPTNTITVEWFQHTYLIIWVTARCTNTCQSISALQCFFEFFPSEKLGYVLVALTLMFSFCPTPLKSSLSGLPGQVAAVVLLDINQLHWLSFCCLLCELSLTSVTTNFSRWTKDSHHLQSRTRTSTTTAKCSPRQQKRRVTREVAHVTSPITCQLINWKTQSAPFLLFTEKESSQFNLTMWFFL